MAFSSESLQPALVSLTEHLGGGEVALLSTCNRTEIYSSEPQAEAVAGWLANKHLIEADLLSRTSYQYCDTQAVRHIMRVASGLDSMILGEPQILGQLKASYAVAQEAGTVGRVLGRLFERAFSVAKNVRTSTNIGKCPVSVAYAAVKLSSDVFADITQLSVLLVGGGETVELCARHLKEKQVKQLLFANRTEARAKELAATYGGSSVALEKIHSILPEADIVMTATGSQRPLLGKGCVESALQERDGRPVFMVDLGVPRDIEPEVSQLKEVYLYSVDDLQNIVTENTSLRLQAAEYAESIIQIEASEFMQWLRSLETVGSVRQFRSNAQVTRDRAVQQALRALHNGESPEAVVTRLGYLLTNQLIHEPTLALKQLGEVSSLESDQLTQALLGPDSTTS